jgi:hypothetical protein
MPQNERAHPALSELAIVLMAPAPGVREMRNPAATRPSHKDNDTSGV